MKRERYDVGRVQEQLDFGFEDEEIVRFRRETDRILLTNDDDFFENSNGDVHEDGDRDENQRQQVPTRSRQ